MSKTDGDYGNQNTAMEEEAVCSLICDDLIDEIILGVAFEIHRAIKFGTFFLDETDEMNEEDYEIVDEIGLDVFGQVPMKKQLECVCPHCQRNLAASRFAPHLEKCMGMGRSSSRIANRRIANSGKDAGTDDDENDDDWTYNSDRKGSKKKREKTNHSPRRTKSSKLKNGDISSVNSSNASDGSSGTSASASHSSYENMSLEERKHSLTQMCCVISEHTKKMCTRSHRCPQHSDEQRKAVRTFLLGPQGGAVDLTDDIQVDIDTYDDLDGQLLRDSLGHLWEGGGNASANPSPTDSTSTNNSSTSSKKKDVKKTKNTNTAVKNKKGPSSTNQSVSKSKSSSSSNHAVVANPGSSTFEVN